MRGLKACSGCNTVKPVTEFHKHRQRGYQAQCKACRKEQSRRSYAADPSSYARRNAEYRDGIRDWLRQFKETLRCSRCDTTDSRVLEFHHRNPSEKSFNIGDVTRRGVSIARIRAEILKCDVMCANCHRIVEWELRCETEAA